MATLDNHGVVHEVNVWWAYSCGNDQGLGIKRRDFRIATLDDPCHCGIAANDGTDAYCANLKSFWEKKALVETTVGGKRTYSAKMDAPGDGRWVAYFIEVTYEKSKKLDGQNVEGLIPPFPHDLTGRLVFTSEVSVWPNIFPYADCFGESCGTNLC